MTSLGGVHLERGEFDDRAFSTGNQLNKETRKQDEVIIEECSREEVTSNKQHEAFPIYDDGTFSHLLFAISYK